MKSSFIFAFFLVLFCGSIASANASANSVASCPREQVRYSDTDVQRGSFSDGTCYLMITPLVYSNLVYRSYLWTSEGLLSVFNSYGDGEPEKDASFRTFRFFPRVKALDMNFDAKINKLKVQLSNGDVAGFAGGTAQISEIGMGTVDVQDVNRNNRGGLEFPTYQGLMLDAGWMFGNSTESDSNGKSLFRDSYGQTCEVKNSDIFVYLANGNWNFKFNDKDLSVYLKKTCPNLKINF